MRLEGGVGRQKGAVALAGVVLPTMVYVLAGCGAPDRYAGYDPEDAAALKRVARLEFPKVTMTPAELGMDYAQEAWKIATEPFELKYRPIAERHVFEWDYLDELAEKRRVLLSRARKERAAYARKALAKRKKEQRDKEQAAIRARAKAKREELLKAAAKTEAAPSTEKPPAPPAGP